MLDAIPAADAPARPVAHTLAPVPTPPTPAGAQALLSAARTLLPVLEAGRPLDAPTLRDAMTRSFGASDAAGAWVWQPELGHRLFLRCLRSAHQVHPAHGHVRGGPRCGGLFLTMLALTLTVVLPPAVLRAVTPALWRPSPPGRPGPTRP